MEHTVKRGRLRQKKGQGLPMNTVIITILVILVLVVVAAFFLGGTSNLVSKIREVFFGSISGVDLAFAASTCQQRCDQLELLPKNQLERSAYCKDYFNIDIDNDGEAEYTEDANGGKQYDRYYCFRHPAQDQPTAEIKYDNLGVPCHLNGVTPQEYCAPF